MALDNAKDVARKASQAYEDIQRAQQMMSAAIKRLTDYETVLNAAKCDYGLMTTISTLSEIELFQRNIQKYTVVDPQGDE